MLADWSEPVLVETWISEIGGKVKYWTEYKTKDNSWGQEMTGHNLTTFDLP